MLIVTPVLVAVILIMVTGLRETVQKVLHVLIDCRSCVRSQLQMSSIKKPIITHLTLSVAYLPFGLRVYYTISD